MTATIRELVTEYNQAFVLQEFARRDCSGGS
jgi:hypothetical protein